MKEELHIITLNDFKYLYFKTATSLSWMVTLDTISFKELYFLLVQPPQLLNQRLREGQECQKAWEIVKVHLLS